MIGPIVHMSFVDWCVTLCCEIRGVGKPDELLGHQTRIWDVWDAI